MAAAIDDAVPVVGRRWQVDVQATRAQGALELPLLPWSPPIALPRDLQHLSARIGPVAAYAPLDTEITLEVIRCNNDTRFDQDLLHGRSSCTMMARNSTVFSAVSLINNVLVR
jgi:hypothetical protein